ncbi:MAG TPA: hypothetical protein VFJ80_08565 [Candidatus Limnocylindrales bacterium]|nr:hypothetical protein [Candidatus Limnocylindrales bacterium]
MNHRTALFTGAFLATAGIVMLAGAGNTTLDGLITDALRLWPLAIIALGVGLLLRRTRLALVGTLVAAIIPGLLLGGVVAAAPDMSSFCDKPASGPIVQQDGTFRGPATVDLDLACGDLAVDTVDGADWHITTVDIGDDAARVVDQGDRLTVTSYPNDRRVGWDRTADDWHVALPTGVPLSIHAAANAGRADLDLANARISDLDVEVNAGAARLDLTSTTVEHLAVVVHAGGASIRLPASGVLSGDLEVAAGSLQICRPESLGLRVHGDVVFGSATLNGLVRVGDAWQTPDYPTAASRADLSVTARAGSVTVDPQGGCK